MRIAMANDHAGLPLKLEIKAWLESQGHSVLDYGTHTSDAADLPDYVYPAAVALSEGKAERAIFVDGVGYGSAMIANKVPGVFAAVCQDSFCAELARSHSDTNALCLGGKIIGSAIAMEIVRVWMTTEWLGHEEPKYARRVAKVVEIDQRHCVPAATDECCGGNSCGTGSAGHGAPAAKQLINLKQL
jgi:ribose 5-phosphate isomerase B